MTLSYVWAKESNPVFVAMSSNNYTILITHNLETAPRRFRHPEEPRTRWIDALCIDQKSIDEKNRQVAIMGTVYSAASFVLIWLGPEQNRSGVALTFIQYLSRYIEMDWHISTIRSSIQCPASELHRRDRSKKFPFENGELD
jgi:hypothetical protein